jgi:hypothetical protein
MDREESLGAPFEVRNRTPDFYYILSGNVPTSDVCGEYLITLPSRYPLAPSRGQGIRPPPSLTRDPG